MIHYEMYMSLKNAKTNVNWLYNSLFVVSNQHGVIMINVTFSQLILRDCGIDVHLVVMAKQLMVWVSKRRHTLLPPSRVVWQK